MKFTTGKNVAGELPSAPPSAEVQSQLTALSTTVAAAETKVQTIAGASAFTGLIDFTAAKSEGKVYGPTASYKASGALEVGVPVALDYTTGGLTVKAYQVGDTPLGFTTTGAAAAGDTVLVATRGSFCTVRRKTDQRVDHALTAASSSSVITNRWVRFFDSGGLGGNYNNGENYSVVFDAGEGADADWQITANDWNFETTDYSMYDRLGVQYAGSASGPWGNPLIPGLWESDNSVAPWSASVKTRGGPGYLWAETPSLTLARGNLPYHPYPYWINRARFIRFTFYSDGSATRPGWDINLLSNKYKAIGTNLYLDQNNPGFVSEYQPAAGAPLAQIIHSDDSGDSIYVLVL